MKSKKRLSDLEYFQLIQLGDENGWQEILRAVAQRICHESADQVKGDEIRSRLFRIANEVAELKDRFE